MASSLKTSAATIEDGDLIYDPAALASARAIAVLVPGALCRIGIFEAAEAWRKQGYGLVYYRFPGLDGRSLTPALDLAGAAAEIAALVQRYPDKPLRFLGYSTGTAIVLKAATRLSGRDLRIAAMAPAVELAGGFRTTWRSALDLLRAALNVCDLRVRPVWFAYYRLLLFGRAIYGDSDLTAQAEALIERRRAKIVVPTGPLVHAHTRDLKRWRMSAAERAAGQGMHLYWGTADVIFDRAQIEAFASCFAGAQLTCYSGQGHLLFATCPEAFEDVLGFFEAGGEAGIPADRRGEDASGAGHSD